MPQMKSFEKYNDNEQAQVYTLGRTPRIAYRSSLAVDCCDTSAPLDHSKLGSTRCCQIVSYNIITLGRG